MSIDYTDFLASKRLLVPSVGKEIDPSIIHPSLFPFQRDLVVWAIRKGRAALFTDTGTGKSFMQAEWARLMGEKTLILAPLSVAKQTIREAAKLGIEITYSRDGSAPGMITITNYEMVDKFNPDEFGAIILDESSILKALNGKIRKQITLMFADTLYKLCCTATPAPNDVVELGNHSEFLGVLTRADMLSTFFMHSKDPGRDGASSTDGWKLKAHAREPFNRWLASWGISMRKPSDLGFSDEGYNLPPLHIIPEWVHYEYVPEGQLFNTGLKGVTDRSEVRRGTLDVRVERAAELIAASDENWIAWVGLNDEEKALAALLPDAVVITGSMAPERKAELIEDFQDGKYRVLITKASIAGFGINLQNCHNQVFVGMNDSYEMYYQAVRRSYRFGQQNPVNVHIVLSTVESPILENVKNKEREALKMSEALISAVRNSQLEELGRTTHQGFVYTTDEVETDRYRIMLGDSCERLQELESDSIDLSVFSPPFSAIYAYTPDERDLANSRGIEEFFEHFRYIIRELYRVTKPGRNACVHIMQLPATRSYHGFIGLIDFHGQIIQAFSEAGWHFYGEAVIQKNPQVQAQRTKKLTLLFRTLKKDSTQLAPGIPDYLVIFKKPGDNEVPVTPIDNGEMTEDDWISWAHPLWTDIRETEVLNSRLSKENQDEKHVAPLQLEVIRRAVVMYSNPDEVVLDPFGGLGTTGFVAVKAGRRAVMCELKPSYFRQMQKNMREAAREGHYQMNLFGFDEAPELAETRNETAEFEFDELSAD
jgi:DNA modification methylase